MGCPKLHTKKMNYCTKGVQGHFVVFIKSDAKSYGYGFQKMEKDNDIKGQMNSLDFDTRIYDSLLGRRLSLGPLQAKYPDLSPYYFCANSPILFVDPDGKGIFIYYDTGKKNKKGEAKIKEAEYKNGALVAKKEIKHAK
jgi:RHS repeat-associated protein